jgi:hypothetical protein
MLLALTAAITGVISGMAIGGGALLVPALVFLFGARQQVAQGVVLLAFIPTALVAAVTHYVQGNVDLRRVWQLAGGGLIGGAVGATLATMVSPGVLRNVFGAYLLAVAVYSFFSRPPGERGRGGGGKGSGERGGGGGGERGRGGGGEGATGR